MNTDYYANDFLKNHQNKSGHLESRNDIYYRNNPLTGTEHIEQKKAQRSRLYNFIASENPDFTDIQVHEAVTHMQQKFAEIGARSGTADRAKKDSNQPSFVPKLPPLPREKLAHFEGGRGSNPIAFAREYYGIWIQARVMDWEYLFKIDETLAMKIKASCQNNNRRGKDGPKKLLDIFPDVKTARTRIEAVYFGFPPKESLKIAQ